MAENSKIQWTTHTFNPWIGCTKVSDGCKFCYAETLMDKRYGRVKWGPQGKRVKTSPANWRKPIQWNKQAEAEGVRYRVFCCSLADVFEDHPTIDPGWRIELWDMIESTPYLDWQLLTKRPENVPAMAWRWMPYGEFPSNVWIGTSVENQMSFAERIPKLLEIPAAVRFLSIEPLIGPVDISAYLFDEWGEDHGGLPGDFALDLINWVIVGGESGSSARPFHLEWATSIIEDCNFADVPVFMKQVGSKPMLNGRPFVCKDSKGGDMAEWPSGLQVREFPQVAVTA